MTSVMFTTKSLLVHIWFPSVLFSAFSASHPVISADMPCNVTAEDDSGVGDYELSTSQRLEDNAADALEAPRNAHASSADWSERGSGNTKKPTRWLSARKTPVSKPLRRARLQPRMVVTTDQTLFLILPRAPGKFAMAGRFLLRLRNGFCLMRL